ncbi:MAG TPA: hypothetical protein VF719_09045 [Abditibacteriaceae bacterium]
MLNIIPRPVHAVLDYGYAIKALAAPWLFGFADEPAAKVASEVAGAVTLVSTLATRHEGGVVKMLPFNTHLKMDAIHAVVTAASPWVFGFAHNTRARNVFLGLALLEVVVVALSEPDSE